jgi:hypothetical protein
MKLDVQGAELRVLAGAGRLLTTTELLILEVSLYRFLAGAPIFHEVVAFMAERGFAVFDVAGLLRRPLDGSLAQVDLCFAREDGMLRASQRWG